MEKVTVLPSGTDLNTVIESGIYRLNGNGETFTNGIGPDCGWGIMVVGSYIDTTFQELYTLANRSFTRMRASDVNWSSWARLATATKPAVYDLPLAAGWRASGQATYYKTQEGICFVNCKIIRDNLVPEGSVIASLPAGFRPNQLVSCGGHAYKNDQTLRSIADINIYNDGSIAAWPSSYFDYISFFVGFVAS